VTVEDNHTVLAGRNGKFQWVGQSFFGVSDHPYFRLSADGVGAAITAVSRYVSWVGVQEIEAEGYELVYGDTDSLLMSLLDHSAMDAESINDLKAATVLEEVNETVNNGLSRVADDVGLPDTHPYIEPDMHGTDRHLWMYEPEKVYRRFLMTGAKKRYAGSIVWKEGKFVDNIDITGYDFERANTPEISKQVQREIIERVLRAESFESLSEYVGTQIDRLENIDAPLRTFAFPGVLNKPPSEYPNRPIKRATTYSNRHLRHDWGEGDSPWYVYVDETPMSKPNTDVIAVSWDRQDLPTGFQLDAEKHIEKTIRGPIEDIVDVVGYSWSELRTGRQEQSVFTQTDADSPDDIFE
jgi:DNA polymerase elongation subunit (family B)